MNIDAEHDTEVDADSEGTRAAVPPSGGEDVVGSFSSREAAKALRKAACGQLRRHGEVIVPELDVAATMGRRMKGLLGRPSLADDAGLWIVPCSSIHMFFMKFPIDVVYVDKAGVVVRCVANVQPWKTSRGGKGAHSVFELAAGAIARHGISEGDQLIVTAVS